MKKIKILILLLYSLFCRSQINQDIDFGNGFIGDKSNYNDYIKYINDTLVPFSYNILHKENSIKTFEEKFTNSKQYWSTNNFVIYYDNEFNISKIVLGNTKLKIKNLFKQYTDYDENYPIQLQSINKIIINDKKFIVIKTSFDSNLSTYNSLSFTFAFEVSNDNVLIIPFKTSSHSSIICYDDFNNDGNLDYLYIEGCDNKLLTFYNNNTEQLQELYLKLICIYEFPDIIFMFIDLKQSHWNLNLKKAWQLLVFR